MNFAFKQFHYQYSEYKSFDILVVRESVQFEKFPFVTDVLAMSMCATYFRIRVGGGSCETLHACCVQNIGMTAQRGMLIFHASFTRLFYNAPLIHPLRPSAM